MRTKQFKAESKKLLDLMINSIYTPLWRQSAEEAPQSAETAVENYIYTCNHTSIGYQSKKL